MGEEGRVVGARRGQGGRYGEGERQGKRKRKRRKEEKERQGVYIYRVGPIPKWACYMGAEAAGNWLRMLENMGCWRLHLVG